ncbi:monocyte to macrophage differentiation factor 2-like [Stegodyphus dumicola]|uniref:monocyte to macrophage differentiation factor 2-like n=1 Tax=Stegodyphus dumicola TaxID=202533 RepID=UPI0015A9E441|nr:monocyte to macrophage differentiation factor 2-like [Stegodyphus dumicola]
MNARASGNKAYIPTDLEHIANVLTHALSVIPSLMGLFLLLQRSNDKRKYFSGFVYGAALVSLFLISTIFHYVFYTRKFRSLKEALHLCDRAIIYIFIAASYTPWLMLKDAERNFWTQNLSWIVWTMAVLGIVYQYYFHEKYKTLETLFYLVIGITPAYAMFYMYESSGMWELCMGGLVYITGVLFFKSDGRIPCAHAIWHLFVNIGATFHFYAVYKYLINDEHHHQPQNQKEIAS